MTSARSFSERATESYRQWQRGPVSVGGRSVMVASKPGVFAHGHADPSGLLLAQRVPIANGDVVVHMNCGNGLFGAVAATGGLAERVFLTDRNVVSAEAARRTLAANAATNAATNAEAFVGHGRLPLPAGVEADIVAIRIPQEKLALLQLLHDAFEILKDGGRCYLAGANNEGAKSAGKMLEQLFGNVGVLAHDSGHRLVVARKRAPEPGIVAGLETAYLDHHRFHTLDASLRGMPFSLSTRPGVFSWDHLDEATELLAAEMLIHPGESVLDLGCGYAPLGVLAASLSTTGRVRCVDADSEAVRCAERTLSGAMLTNAAAMTSDVASAVASERFDVVATNPPFHVGKATELAVPLEFIQESWECLHTGGRLYLVANRTLPYERAIAQRFGNITTLHDGRRFKVLSATKAAAS